ncbi:PKD domain-containing protein [Formosa agariphila KMM 3901]|uniref:PKD domain-containing protein n=2 Tax=Formosa TaxID=225842 RepID=T2KMM2_FORAG|nr:PKD domain-containing protein [Formosa agariphila KMM 3901]
MSQSGDYVLIQYNTRGGGKFEGTKSYDKKLNLLRHLTDINPHGDIGFDQNGKEVWVSNDDNYIRSITLEGNDKEIQYSYVSGGHVSCRNINRPGWAYINDHGDISQPQDYAAFREIFAVKLDEKVTGKVIVNRFSKTYAKTNKKYYHEPHASVSPDGTKLVFKSNMEIDEVEVQKHPFAWVVEFSQDSDVAVNIEVNAGEDQTICKDDEVTLKATGASTYEWSTGEKTQSITVSPNSTTTYTVTGKDDSGNSDTDEVKVTVQDLPTIDAGDDVEVCEDSSVQLTASGSGDFKWSTGETAKTITVKPDKTTTYTVTASNGTCSSSDEVTVTVSPRQTINAGSDKTIDLGESTTLSVSGTGSIKWSTGESTPDITVSPEQTTTYTVTVSQNGCESQDQVTVTVNANKVEVIADAGDNQTICEGETVTLTASGGTSYKWSNGSTSSSISVSPNTTTTYSVEVSEDGVSDTAEVTVNVNALPVANAGANKTIDQGESITLSASGGTRYIWNTGETTQNITVSPNQTKIYTVEVFNEGDCSDSDQVTVTVNIPQIIVNADAGDNQTICEGETVTLTASGGTSYKWSNGATSSSISVSPNTTTTYSVEVSKTAYRILQK